MQHGAQQHQYQSIALSDLSRVEEEAVSLQQRMLEEMPLVHAIAKNLHRSLPQEFGIDDLISAGSVGLIEALQKFDPERHIKFKTFASARIRGAMLDTLRKLDWAARPLRRRERAIEQAIVKCTSALGRVPEEDEIAQELGIELEELQRALSDLHGVTLGSLQEIRPGSEVTELDLLASTDEPGPLVHCLRAELRALLEASLEALPAQERLVVTLYYYEELTNEEIAGVLRLSESRAAQLRTSAILRIRALLGEHADRRVPA